MDSTSSERAVESLEGIRQRTTQIVHSLSHFLAILHQTEQLAPWPTIHKNFNILLSQIHSLSNTLAIHFQSLRTTNIFPSEEFPVREQEPLLTTLLRTRPLPVVEEWESATLEEYENDPSLKSKSQKKPLPQDVLWEEARDLLMQERERYNWTGYVTRQEELRGEIINQKELEEERAFEEQNAQQTLTKILGFMKSGRG
ncbi:mediator complex subunit Med8 [Schizosaccharomyces octosporus yFS286]|uniref:Mediator of RNA polymerase II transcription subunit 8 n=1 Tax=Schizosaccharomyces octosporus (strain yFS286) TaxID=483514 RepID=S9PWK9_SCHOY|nr:mediator complex subunit Med8 [Schizosaccharomyces octosporus yFS286]EPX72382.1 mediator complex subunit Med8 [Schizosaccharomyces octosporus yFS286]